MLLLGSYVAVAHVSQNLRLKLSVRDMPKTLSRAQMAAGTQPRRSYCVFVKMETWLRMSALGTSGSRRETHRMMVINTKMEMMMCRMRKSS